MLITIRYDLKKRKEKETFRKLNAKLSGTKYVSQLNDWSIKFVYKAK